MTTLRQIERLFNAHQFRRLYAELMNGRVENAGGLAESLGHVVPVAALAMIRIDELSQGRAPLYRRLLNVVLTAQEKDGGWGDPLVTAVCVRALLCGQGQGAAIERGLHYLASLQKSEGIWPNEPIRRMGGSPLVSALMLLLLGDHVAFRDAVRFDDAIDWFFANGGAIEPEARRLWEHARARCRIVGSRRASSTLWSGARSAA